MLGARRRTRRRGVGAAVLPAALAALLAAGPGGAEELILGMRTTLDHSDQIVGDESGFGFRFRPESELRDPDGRLQWSLRYNPSYELFPEFSGANGWNHNVRAELEWDVTKRTRLTLTDRFRSLNSERLFNEQVLTEGGETTTVTEGTTRRFTTNSLQAELRHVLTPTDTLTLSLDSDLRDQDEDPGEAGGSTRDTTSTSITSQYRHMLSARTTIGLGLSAARNEFDQGLGDESETDFYNLFASWQHRFDESFQVSVAAGPALIDSGAQDRQLRPVVARAFPLTNEGEHVDATTCPLNDAGQSFLPPGGGCESVGDLGFLAPGFTVAQPLGDLPSRSESRVSVFANMSLSKYWDDWRLSLGYRRRQSQSGQFGSSTISDVVTAGLRWTPTPRWSLRVTGQWNRQTQATDQALPVLAVGRVGDFFGPDNDLGSGGEDLPTDAAVVTGLTSTTFESDAENIVMAGRFGSRYRLTRRLSVFTNAFYSQQESDFAGEDREIYRFAVGFAYEFDPMRF